MNEKRGTLLLIALGLGLALVVDQLRRLDMVSNPMSVLLLAITCVLMGAVAYLAYRLGWFHFFWWW